MFRSVCLKNVYMTLPKIACPEYALTIDSVVFASHLTLITCSMVRLCKPQFQLPQLLCYHCSTFVKLVIRQFTLSIQIWLSQPRISKSSEWTRLFLVVQTLEVHRWTSASIPLQMILFTQIVRFLLDTSADPDIVSEAWIT